MHIKSIFTVYHFDAMFNMESAIPDHSQLFETFALKNCLILNLSKGMLLTLFLVVLIWYQTLCQNSKW